MINDYNSGRYFNINEKLEINLIKTLMNSVDKEERTNGEVAYVVKDFDQLVITIIKFIKEHANK